MAMNPPTTYDVLIVGGGMAGASLAGVLARAGLGVLVVEREATFRDRVRGEFTWPWGFGEAQLLGLDAVLASVDAIPLSATHVYAQHTLTTVEPIPAPGMLGFSHPQLQEALVQWAAAGGATTLRPAKAIGMTRGTVSTVTVVHDGQAHDYCARLVVGADGKRSAVRHWAGGETVVDPEHHRFGGVLVQGLSDDWSVLADGSTYETGCLWFSPRAGTTRLYLRMSAEQLRQTQADRDFDTFVRMASTFMPEGALEGAVQAGPLAFFPNSCVWSSCLAGNGVVLLGDAAGSADPSWGRGTSLLYRDVRELRDRLLGELNWDRAIAEFAQSRAQTYAVVRAYDHWTTLHAAEDGPEAECRRAQRNRAKEADPTLGGFKLIELQGPDGLVADEAARQHYFGEDLPGLA